MNISGVGEMGVGETGVGETGQIIGETGVGEMGVGETGTSRMHGYGTFRAKTSSSLGRFDRDDSRKKPNGTVRAKKLGRFAQNQI